MEEKQVHTQNLEMVIDALASESIFAGQPTLFSETYRQELTAIRSSENGMLPLDAYNLLVAERVKEELLADIFKANACVQSEAYEELSDLYLNKEVYEETINRFVEEINGGVMSYDYTSHVLDAYDHALRADKIPNGTVLGVDLLAWLRLCTGIHQARHTMDNQLYQAQRTIIAQAYRAKK